MKTFQNQAAQGDLLVRRIDELPDGVRPVKADGGLYVVAHSEPGHHHAIAEQPCVEMFSGEDPLVAYLRVIDDAEVKLEHHRSYDQHESLCIPGGTYEIRRQREHTPEGWRRVQD